MAQDWDFAGELESRCAGFERLLGTQPLGRQPPDKHLATVIVSGYSDVHDSNAFGQLKFLENSGYFNGPMKDEWVVGGQSAVGSGRRNCRLGGQL